MMRIWLNSVMMMTTRKNHRYASVQFPHPDAEMQAAGIPQTKDVCKHCGTIREVIGTVGDHLQIRSYIAPDGIRHTGCAPECNGKKV